MRYAAAEKLEILRLVEQSSLSARRTLTQLGIPRSDFCCWCESLSRPRRGRPRGSHAGAAAGVEQVAGQRCAVGDCARPQRAGGVPRKVD
jgi:hypothetical protein